ncbi:MAG: membrane protein insertase YidC [Patescibacteria group bacterium]|nr:membrane protein insertase YidC [Patescibacteria group bacterium]MDE1966237.1 membrane protein insertase YidC [Patescibacteria group bacterium]
MVSTLFHAVFYNPIYNLLVFLVALSPGGDVGIAIVIATLIVKLLLLPLSMAAIRTQREMKRIEPLLAELKTKHPDRQEQAMKTMELYREHRINPFASIVTIFIQLPVLITLYWVFRAEAFPTVHTALLYGFTMQPAHVSLMFLGLFDVTGHSLVLAVLAGIAQYLQAHFMSAPLETAAHSDKAEGSFQTDFARAMQVQMKYVLPLIIGTFAYTSGVVALYFITSALFQAFQEYFVLRKVREKYSDAPVNASQVSG